MREGNALPVAAVATAIVLGYWASALHAQASDNTIPCEKATAISLAYPDKTNGELKRAELLLLNNRLWLKGREHYDQNIPLIQFDLSSIPSKTKITSAVLKLSFHGRGQVDTRPAINIYPIQDDWNAQDVTWNTKPSWDESYSEVEISPQPNFDDKDTWDMDITPLVQKWVDGKIENHGLVIVAKTDPGDVSNFAFFSMNRPGSAPVLVVTAENGSAQ